MAKKSNNEGCPVKTSLKLKRYGAHQWIDQYGRVLEVYTDRKTGKPDLRPIGVGIPK